MSHKVTHNQCITKYNAEKFQEYPKNSPGLVYTQNNLHLPQENPESEKTLQAAKDKKTLSELNNQKVKKAIQRKEDEQRIRKERYILKNQVRHVLPRSRTNICKKWVLPKENVCVCKGQDSKKAHYKGLETCASVWLCPVCSSKISERKREELTKAIETAEKNEWCVHMATLTNRHGLKHKLKDIIEIQKHVLTSMSSGKNNLETLLQRKGIILHGFIRAFEITNGTKNGWHPHQHILYFTSLKSPLNLEKTDINHKIKTDIDSIISDFWLKGFESLEKRQKDIEEPFKAFNEFKKNNPGKEIPDSLIPNTFKNTNTGKTNKIQPIDFFLNVLSNDVENVLSKDGDKKNENVNSLKSFKPQPGEVSVKVEDAKAAKKYITKFGKGSEEKEKVSYTWGAEHEITKSNSKKAKKENIHPFDLLKVIDRETQKTGKTSVFNDDDNLKEYTKEKAIGLFKQYAEATKGVSQVFWSKGFKDKCNVNQKTDADIEKEKTEESDTLVTLDLSTWKNIISKNDECKVLDNAENLHVIDFVNSLKPYETDIHESIKEEVRRKRQKNKPGGYQPNPESNKPGGDPLRERYEIDELIRRGRPKENFF